MERETKAIDKYWKLSEIILREDGNFEDRIFDSSNISDGLPSAIKKGSYNLGRSRFWRIMFLHPDFKLRLRYERRSVLGAGIDCGYERVIYLSRFSFRTVPVFFPISIFLLSFFPFCIVQIVQNSSQRQIWFQCFSLCKETEVSRTLVKTNVSLRKL